MDSHSRKPLRENRVVCLLKRKCGGTFFLRRVHVKILLGETIPPMAGSLAISSAVIMSDGMPVSGSRIPRLALLTISRISSELMSELYDGGIIR